MASKQSLTFGYTAVALLALFTLSCGEGMKPNERILTPGFIPTMLAKDIRFDGSQLVLREPRLLFVNDPASAKMPSTQELRDHVLFAVNGSGPAFDIAAMLAMDLSRPLPAGSPVVEAIYHHNPVHLNATDYELIQIDERGRTIRLAPRDITAIQLEDVKYPSLIK